MEWSHKFTLLSEKPPEGHSLSGGRLTKIQATTRPDYLWPDVCPSMSKKSSRQMEKKTAFNSMKSAREMLETPFGSSSCWVAVGVKV